MIWFVKRKADTSIGFASQVPTDEATEAVDDTNSAELTAFLTPSAAAVLSNKLAVTDLVMARATEDLIALLLLKGIINKTDVPPAIFATINARRAIRGQGVLP